MVYVTCKDFAALWKKYLDYLPEVDYPFDLVGKVVPRETDMAEIKCVYTEHRRSNEATRLYHLFINMPELSQ